MRTREERARQGWTKAMWQTGQRGKTWLTTGTQMGHATFLSMRVDALVLLMPLVFCRRRFLILDGLDPGALSALLDGI